MPIKEKALQWGWRRSVYWHVMHWLATRALFRIHYVSIGADRPALRMIYRAALDVPDGYTVRWGTREDFLPAIGTLPDVDQQFVDDAFGRGDECVVVYYRDELVNYCFGTRAWARVSEQLRVVVPKGFRYIYKAWTHPDHRRKHLSALNAQFRNLTREAPFEERSISYVETHNYPSLLNTGRHPSERGIRCGLVGWFTVFGRQIPFSSRHAKWIGFEFSRHPHLE